MLANHPVIAVGPGALGWSGRQKSRRKAARVRVENLDIAHYFPAHAEVCEIAGPRQTEHPEVNR